jgi:hypothetical protein
MERLAVSYVRLGKCLRKCRRSIRPPYSQQDLAACIHSEPACQGIFPPSIQGPNDLVPVIEELEAYGRWALLPPPLLYPFLEASVNCLIADCRPNLIKEFAAIIAAIIAADFGQGYPNIVNQYLPEQGNPSENENEEDEGEEDNDGND